MIQALNLLMYLLKYMRVTLNFMFIFVLKIPNLSTLNEILKLVSAIFYQIFTFSPNYSPSKTMKNVFLFHLKSSSCSQDIQILVIFSLPFHTFKIQKDKWKWNNL